MKRIMLSGLPLVAMVFFCGCNYWKSPIQARSVVEKKNPQAEVFNIPTGYTFVVRDTNGAVFYVEMNACNTNDYTQVQIFAAPVR